ncbi:collagen alpha-1(XII) chain-like [Physella acuta]|uniref:collagen alpha-1(XII) chain-like n=1 Tax=Physella acuta TaxID=109671 RepID=UPI0027DE9C77|nr:collagen alpha-1(XII) chain-like [Physella acuta]
MGHSAVSVETDEQEQGKINRGLDFDFGQGEFHAHVDIDGHARAADVYRTFNINLYQQPATPCATQCGELNCVDTLFCGCCIRKPQPSVILYSVVLVSATQYGELNCQPSTQCEQEPSPQPGPEPTPQPGPQPEPEPTPEPEPICISKVKADFVLLMDASTSVGPKDWKKQVEFAAGLTEAFSPDKDDVRFGAVIFNKQPSKIFDLNTFTDSQALSQALRDIKYPNNQGTNTHLGLSEILTQRMFSSEAGGRDDAPNLVIVITDGKSTHHSLTVKAATELKASGVQIISVGVGKEPTKQELEDIASDKSFVFTVDNYGLLDHIKTGLVTITCSVTTAPPTEEPVVTTKEPNSTPEVETTTEAPATTPEVETTTEAPATTPEVETTTEAPATTPEVETTTEAPATTPEVETTTEAPSTTPAIETTTEEQTTTTEVIITTPGVETTTTEEPTTTTEEPTTTTELPTTTTEVPTTTTTTTTTTGVPVSTRPPYPPSTPEPCTETTKADIILIMDASSSIQKENWKYQTQLSANITQYFNVGPDNVRFGAMIFNRMPKKQFDLKDHLDHDSLSQTLLAIAYPNVTGTKTYLALDEITKQDMFGTAAGGRPDAPDILIIMTDGKSDIPSRTLKSATALKDKGITLISVGIGAEPTLDELTGLASKPENVFTINSYDLLAYIMQSLVRKTCESSHTKGV